VCRHRRRRVDGNGVRVPPSSWLGGMPNDAWSVIIIHICTDVIYFMGGTVVQWLACLTREREVMGSTPGRRTIRQQLWASCQHPCASVTKQYNLVSGKGRWCCVTRKVTIGLASHSHWPCVIDSVVYPPTGSQPLTGRWAPHLHFILLYTSLC